MRIGNRAPNEHQQRLQPLHTQPHVLQAELSAKDNPHTLRHQLCKLSLSGGQSVTGAAHHLSVSAAISHSRWLALRTCSSVRASAKRSMDSSTLARSNLASGFFGSAPIATCREG